jgi:hypothetical protein
MLIQKFFDSVDHTRMIEAVEANTDQPWVVLYVKRWLVAPIQHTDGSLHERDKGTPQGVPLQVSCPRSGGALALVGAARQLGVTARSGEAHGRCRVLPEGVPTLSQSASGLLQILEESGDVAGLLDCAGPPVGEMHGALDHRNPPGREQSEDFEVESEAGNAE